MAYAYANSHYSRCSFEVNFFLQFFGLIFTCASLSSGKAFKLWPGLFRCAVIMAIATAAATTSPYCFVVVAYISLFPLFFAFACLCNIGIWLWFLANVFPVPVPLSRFDLRLRKPSRNESIISNCDLCATTWSQSSYNCHCCCCCCCCCLCPLQIADILLFCYFTFTFSLSPACRAYQLKCHSLQLQL